VLVICFLPIGCATLQKIVGECIEGDCINGQGTMLYRNGNKYVGQFKGGVPHGQGTVTYPDGRKEVGRWQNGKLIGR